MIKFSLYKYKFLSLFLIIGLAGFFFWAFAQTSFFDPPEALIYAPNFHFDSEENYYPTDPLDFYYDKDINEIAGPIAKEKYDKLTLKEKKKQFKIFYQIKNQRKEWVYEYLSFYVFNNFKNEHYADWETIYVFVNKYTKKVNRVVGVAHNGTKWKIAFANNELSKPESNHTSFLIEKGSHSSTPDGNNDGLFQDTKDITNWYNSYAYYFFDWSLEDKNNGLKINYNDSDYKLERLFFLQEKLKGKKSFTKSPELGINIQKSQILKLISVITGIKYIPLGGEPSNLADIEETFNDPGQVRPITTELVFEWGIEKAAGAEFWAVEKIEKTKKRVVAIKNWVVNKVSGTKNWIAEKIKGTKTFIIKQAEKTENAVSDAMNVIQNGVNEIVKQVGLILSITNPFPAAIIPINSISKPSLPVNPETEKEISISKEEITKNESFQSQSLSEEEKLAQIQESLDDIFENLDIISQEVGNIISEYESSVKEDVEIEIKDEEKETEKEKTEEFQEKFDGQKEIVLCESANIYSSAARNKIIINEIAWMGTEISANDEWIELKNISGQKVDLADWQILDKTRQIKVVFNNGEFISPNGFYLLERTDDDSVPNIAADKIYTGGLNNTDESLELFNDSCGLEDRVLTSPDWTAGDKDFKRTMERKNVFSWQDSNNIGGTPKRENSSGYFAGGGNSSASPSPSESVSEPEPEPPVSVLSKILISEVASGWATSGNEFIELYNPNNEPLSISSDNFRLKLVNSENSTTTKKINWNSNTIPPKGYFLLVAGEISGGDQILAPDATYSRQLTAVSGIIIEDKNYGNVLDKVSWGKPDKLPPSEAAEGNGVILDQGLKTNQSLERKWLTTTENYIDTDDNSQDFVLELSPDPTNSNGEKFILQLEEEDDEEQEEQEEENQPPIASFIFSPQNPFANDEILFNTSSSTDSDGEISLFVWDFGDGISASTTQATTTHSFVTFGDFTVNLWAVDNFGATSSPATTTVSVLPKIVISEIQIDSILGPGGAGNDFIEIYNSASTTVDISDWRLKKKSSKGTESSIKVLKEGSIIPAKEYFLWVNSQYSSSSDLISADATSSQTISKDNSIALFNKEGNIIDAVGWGSSTDPFIETALFSQNPEGGQSLGRKWSTATENYIDTDDNLADFEIQEPTPNERNKLKLQPILSISPEDMDFTKKGSQTLTISNEGNGILKWTGFVEYKEDEPEWIILSQDSGTATSEILVSVDISNLEIGHYEAPIIISSPGSINSPQEITISLTILQKTIQAVVINEIAWMGTKINSTDEWMELYNNTDQDIDLTGWQLKTKSGFLDIIFSASTTDMDAYNENSFPVVIIPAHGFYLLERDADDTVQDISAEQIYGINLGNSNEELLSDAGEELELLDANGNLIDSVGCIKDEQGNCESWFAGSNNENNEGDEEENEDGIKQTMERINSELSGLDPDNWADNNMIDVNGKDDGGLQINGTPKAENSVSKENNDGEDDNNGGNPDIPDLS